MKIFYSDKKPKLAKSVISLLLAISAVFTIYLDFYFWVMSAAFFLITESVYSIRLLLLNIGCGVLVQYVYYYH